MLPTSVPPAPGALDILQVSLLPPPLITEGDMIVVIIIIHYICIVLFSYSKQRKRTNKQTKRNAKLMGGRSRSGQRRFTKGWWFFCLRDLILPPVVLHSHFSPQRSHYKLNDNDRRCPLNESERRIRCITQFVTLKHLVEDKRGPSWSQESAHSAPTLTNISTTNY